MSKQPRFKIGEQVILCSNHLTKYNGGPYTVEEIVSNLNYCKGSSGFAYVLDGAKYTEEEWPHPSKAWAEPSLRKYYPPSELSFQELMTTLKTPIKERI